MNNPSSTLPHPTDAGQIEQNQDLKEIDENSVNSDAFRLSYAQLGTLPDQAIKGRAKLEIFEVILDTRTQ